MKYRILEKEGDKFYIQCKRKYWFWVGTYEHGKRLRERMGDFGSAGFKVYYSDYKSAKENQDRLIKYMLEIITLRKNGPKIHDIVDMDNEEDVFVGVL
tara:strand:- start:2579 stop:2872 length:294 start_codon:yes stop_codon:yes gene_type:complete